jgi:cytochrome oxidase assembly protein ShyY1
MPERRADYRFARRPAWIAGHLLAGTTVVLMVGLGLWQLDRLDARQARNELVVARAAAEPVDVGEAIDPGSAPDAVDELRFAAVTATGSYEGESVVVRVTQDGLSGGRVFSPLVLDDGEVVMVLRGFVAQQPDGQVVAPDPPEGEVVVDGLAFPIRRLEPLTRQALDEASSTGDGARLPVVVQATTPDGPDLRVVPPPELGDGPHLSYAVQWFLFAGVVAVGYPLLLRRRARQAGS